MQFPASVTVYGLTAQYDAGATLSISDDTGVTLGSASCYASNGGTTNSCPVTLSQPASGQNFIVTIDSHHSDWNWMGDIQMTLGACPSNDDGNDDDGTGDGIHNPFLNFRPSTCTTQGEQC